MNGTLMYSKTTPVPAPKGIPLPPKFAPNATREDYHLPLYAHCNYSGSPSASNLRLQPPSYLGWCVAFQKLCCLGGRSKECQKIVRLPPSSPLPSFNRGVHFSSKAKFGTAASGEDLIDDPVI